MIEFDTANYSILTKVAGVSYRQDAVSRCRAGETIQLVRNPSNTHDPNAIEVHAGEQIGFIPRDEFKNLVLYLDSYGNDSVKAIIDKLIGGTDDKPTVGVIIDIRVPRDRYNLIDGNLGSLIDNPELIATYKKCIEVDASLTDDDIRQYVKNIDDDTLDNYYWSEQESRWAEEQKKKLSRRLGRDIEGYEEEEIKEKAEERFIRYRDKYKITFHDRERFRSSTTREYVVGLIVGNEQVTTSQTADNTCLNISEQVTANQTENGTCLNACLNIGLIIVVGFVFVVVGLVLL